jgi:glycosyltransferase involved in cell wall biosynthesis
VHYAPTSPRIQILAPIDTAVFAGGNGVNFKEKFKLHGKQIVTYCGTVDTLEGVDILLQAMGIIKREHSNIALVIAGHVSDYDRVVGGKRNYKKLAEELAVSRCTIFTGHLPMNDVIDLLSASDVLVMPKINHPMNNVASPIKIAEYLAAGRPVVASNICELDNHLKHLVHLVFCEPGNINDLVCALVSVLNDYTLRHTLSSNASAIATTLFDYRHIAKTIYEYTSTIKEATFK